jgi:dTDP-4-dehydrorhamnose 3,5-epimerase-like enzyme
MIGKIHLFLYDLRIRSKTYKKKIDLIIDAEKDFKIYYFPPNVAHGYKTLSDINHMMYATSDYYDKIEEYKFPIKNKFIPNFFSEI